MAVVDEKVSAQQHSITDVEHNGSSIEKPAQSYLPQNDSEYTVSLKTWVVVWVWLHQFPG